MTKYLQALEDESIAIIHDTYKYSENPVVLYSIGKDSSVLLHLFRKAFYPLTIPITFMHIDTGWKFKEMIAFRNKIVKKYKLNLIVYKNLDGEANGINPFSSDKYTDIMKTKALKDALNINNFDFIYGGARRDEEASRSKEKILSHRDKNNKWNPKNQRIEPWNIFNTFKNSNESFRVFPLSNWTELNIWEYILLENIEIVGLYLSKKRKVVSRNGQYFLFDDNRFELNENDKISHEYIRFRTLGCYPLTAATLSSANTIPKLISELKSANLSERSGRLIDHDKIGSMELKKKDGYF